MPDDYGRLVVAEGEEAGRSIVVLGYKTPIEGPLRVAYPLSRSRKGSGLPSV